jgi:ribonuclease III
LIKGGKSASISSFFSELMDNISDSIYPDKGRENLLESIIGYTFRDPALRTRAITRRAYVNDIKPGSLPEHEALATLGDAVINVVFLSQLIESENDEGKISKKRDELVNHPHLSNIALGIGIKDCLLLGKCEGNTKEWDKGQALGESLESIIGAIYIDCHQKNEDGISQCKKILDKIGLRVT